MKDKVRSLLKKMEPFMENVSRPIVIIVALVLAVGSIVGFVVLSNYCQSKYDNIASLNIKGVHQEEDGKLTAVLYDAKEEQEHNYSVAKEKIEDAAYPEKEIAQKVETYIELRYNYDDVAESITAESLKKIEELSTDTFYQSVIKGISKDKTEGGSSSEIIRYYSNRNNSDMENDYLTGMRFVFEVNINDKNRLIEYTMLYQGGTWLIDDETIIV